LNIEKSNIEDRLNEIIGLISQEFRDVLIRLLQKDPDKRISIEELKQHGFFDGIVWEEVRARSNPPPLQ
jgi:serine/threonine protein kinase